MKMRNFLQRFISFIIVCLLVVSCIGVPVCAKEPEWKVSLMHPESFFGKADESGYNERKEVTEYLFTVRKDPEDDLEKFAEVLTETDGVTLETNKKTLFGDRKMELEYEGDDCISIHWDKSEKLLSIEYECFVVSCRTETDKIVYGYPAEAFPQEFVDAMINMYASDYGLKDVQTQTLGNGDRMIEVGGKNRVRFDWHDDASILDLTYFNGWSKTETPEETKPAETKPAETKPAETKPAEEKKTSEKKTSSSSKKTEKIDEYSNRLPDLASFLGTKYTQNEWGYTHYVTCLVDKSEKDDIVKAVVDLLLKPKYLLKQMDKKKDSEGTHYTFEYTGKNKEVDWVYLNSGGKYHVKLTVKSYSSSKTALILYTHPEFTLKDPGDRYQSKDSGGSSSKDSGGSSSGGSSSGGSSSGGSSSGGSSSWNSGSSKPERKVKCTRCNNGRIDCGNCDGGWKVERKSVPNYSGSKSGSKWAETKVNCPSCTDGTKDCPSCVDGWK